ncbi:hypothetical protein [Arthrobacter flavus]|uniref:Uncharacterized protein n=1 Tax=Arthrobacter flavus TaxID=95172 RepID=A0ABW4Q6H3_9MICC
MTHRNRLMTFGTCAALVAGSTFLVASPVAAAPASGSCVAAQSALGAALGSASVDIGLAYDLKAALTAIEAASEALDQAWIDAEIGAVHEFAAYDAAIAALETAAMALETTQAALDAAQTAKFLADDRVVAAELALAAVPDGDDAARLAAEAELAAARAFQVEATTVLAARQTERDTAPDAFAAAEEALMEAQLVLQNALDTAAVATAENNYYAAIETIEAVLAALDSTNPGTSVEEVQVLVNAAIAACAATGAGTGQDIEVPVVAIVPSTPAAPGAAAPAAGRGLNVQTAAAEAPKTDGGALAIGGLAGGALILLSGAAVWLRRSAKA